MSENNPDFNRMCNLEEHTHSTPELNILANMYKQFGLVF